MRYPFVLVSQGANTPLDFIHDPYVGTRIIGEFEVLSSVVASHISLGRWKIGLPEFFLLGEKVGSLAGRFKGFGRWPPVVNPRERMCPLRPPSSRRRHEVVLKNE